jgi:hypothetical protein
MSEKLTEIERLLLMNQYKILSLLNPGANAEYTEYLQILKGGYEKDYADLFAQVAWNIPEKESDLVLEILCIYSRIAGAINRDSTQLTDDLKAKAIFGGFADDGTGSLTTYARFAVEIRGDFPGLDILGERSQRRPMSWYRKLISRSEQLGEGAMRKLDSKTIEHLLAD